VWVRPVDGTWTICVGVHNQPGVDGTEPVTTRLPLTLQQLESIALEPGFLG
jgi:hypothetical protein